MICRSYLSSDVEACRRVAAGETAAGPGVLAAQPLMLAVQALVRRLLAGRVKVPTYALARVAEGAMRGEPRAASLAAARHRPRVLADEAARLTPLR
jgi:hypothetical protein